MVSNSLYLTVAIIDLASFAINMLLVWYVVHGKEWFATHWTKKNKIKHGTYIEVSFWDLGFKTGNFPPINIDETLSGMGTSINNLLKPDQRTELIKLLVKDKNQKQIEDILKFIDKQGEKK